MPKAFDRCIKRGGKVFTVKVGKNKYVHGCRAKESKDAVYGEVKKKKQ